MKHIVDIETWERKDNYNFFRGFANSWIAITSEVDCTEAYNHAKANGKSFFLYYLYAILRAANEIKEFRYRWDKNGQVAIMIQWMSFLLLLYPAKHFIRYASLIMLISKHFIPKPDTLSHLFLKMVIHTEPIKAFINKEILM